MLDVSHKQGLGGAMHRQPHLASEARGPLPSITHTNSKSTFKKKKTTQDKYLAPGETQRREWGVQCSAVLG